MLHRCPEFPYPSQPVPKPVPQTSQLHLNDPRNWNKIPLIKHTNLPRGSHSGNILMLVKHPRRVNAFCTILARVKRQWNERWFILQLLSFSKLRGHIHIVKGTKNTQPGSQKHGFQKPKGLYQKYFRFISTAICLYKSLPFKDMWLLAWPCRKSVYLSRTS